MKDIVYTRQFACIEVKHTEEMGFGVYATRDFEKGELIERAYCVKICDHEKDIPVDLKNYTFKYPPCAECDPEFYVLALGYGSIYNHADDNNARFYLSKYPMFFDYMATKNIKEGEEIFINYGNYEFPLKQQ